MTWAFQCVVHVSGKLRGSPDQTWSLPDPVGEVSLHANSRTLLSQKEVTFRAGGYAAEEDAWEAGRKFVEWLKIAGALTGLGMFLGTGQQVSWIGETVRPEIERKLADQGLYLVDDVSGLHVHREQPGTPVRFSLRAGGSVGGYVEPAVEVDDFAAALAEAATRRAEPTGMEAVACDLMSHFGEEASARMKLVALVTAMEALSPRTERTGRARALVEEFIASAEEAAKGVTEADRAELASLLGQLRDLRTQSISRSVREMANRSRPADEEAVRIATSSYTCRSNSVHAPRNGAPPEEWEAFELIEPATGLVRDMLRQSLSN